MTDNEKEIWFAYLKDIFTELYGSEKNKWSEYKMSSLLDTKDLIIRAIRQLKYSNEVNFRAVNRISKERDAAKQRELFVNCSTWRDKYL
jgi:hypothetical protein